MPTRRRPSAGAGRRLRDSVQAFASWRPGTVPPDAMRLIRRPAPDVLVIGAQKAGTTSLHEALAAHPRLWAGGKEHHYFTLRFARGPAWYARQFPRAIDGRLRLESTPAYLPFPLAPVRIRAEVPWARFIVILRDPVSRAISHYHHSVRHGYEDLAMLDAFEAEDTRLAATRERFLAGPQAVLPGDVERWLAWSYLERGDYAAQLGRWFQFFERGRFYITTSDQLWRDPDELVRLQRWLRVPVMTGLRFPDRHKGTYGAPPPGVRQWLAERFAGPDAALTELLGWQPAWARGA